MRDYQRKKNNKYILPNAVYHKTLWQIRDYYRLKACIDDLENTASAIRYDKDPIQVSPSADMIVDNAIKVIEIKKTIAVIDEAKAMIPKEYQSGVWNNILFQERFPNMADRTTYARYKTMFIYAVAEKEGYI